MNATGRALGDWFAILDGHGGRELPHRDIARLLQDEYDVPGRWSQNVAVEYEKHIGRRETGQTQAGDYEAAVTRTLPGDMDAALSRWVEGLPKGRPRRRSTVSRSLVSPVSPGRRSDGTGGSRWPTGPG